MQNCGDDERAAAPQKFKKFAAPAGAAKTKKRQPKQPL